MCAHMYYRFDQVSKDFPLPHFGKDYGHEEKEFLPDADDAKSNISALLAPLVNPEDSMNFYHQDPFGANRDSGENSSPSVQDEDNSRVNNPRIQESKYFDESSP